jgi:hypothetical protein
MQHEKEHEELNMLEMFWRISLPMGLCLTIYPMEGGKIEERVLWLDRTGRTLCMHHGWPEFKNKTSEKLPFQQQQQRVCALQKAVHASWAETNLHCREGTPEGLDLLDLSEVRAGTGTNTFEKLKSQGEKLQSDQVQVVPKVKFC